MLAPCDGNKLALYGGPLRERDKLIKGVIGLDVFVLHGSRKYEAIIKDKDIELCLASKHDLDRYKSS